MAEFKSGEPAQFVAAINKRDAKTIASRWAENGEMTLDGDTGID